MNHTPSIQNSFPSPRLASSFLLSIRVLPILIICFSSTFTQVDAFLSPSIKSRSITSSNIPVSNLSSPSSSPSPSQLLALNNVDAETINLIEGAQFSIPIVLILALTLGILSQTLINSMLKGDQGLSAFLSDGKGYGKSKFISRKPNNGSGNDAPLGSEDPLPWLKLPKFSYVDVAGQDNTSTADLEAVAEELQQLAMRGKRELEAGEEEKAAMTMKEMKVLMEANGIED